MNPIEPGDAAGEKSMVILQSLLCLLREKNLLSRADIEDLAAKVASRAAAHDRDPLPCQSDTVVAAASEMHRLGAYIGDRYGGKHRRI